MGRRIEMSWTDPGDGERSKLVIDAVCPRCAVDMVASFRKGKAGTNPNVTSHDSPRPACLTCTGLIPLAVLVGLEDPRQKLPHNASMLAYETRASGDLEDYEWATQPQARNH